jgi:3-dehydroquinate dehydratase II
VSEGRNQRIEVMHGVNLDQIGRRDPGHYGGLTYAALERSISEAGEQRGMLTRFFQTNHEGEFIEHLHGLEGMADGVILNPGAWAHYAWSLHDALEFAGLPAVEVHLSDVDAREPWRRQSVLEGLVVGRVAGRGPEGYGEALDILARELSA